MEELIPVLQSLVTAVESPSWCDILGVFLSGLGVILSAVAIWFAVQIPKRIAEKQDKISLFERRLYFYNCINKCSAFSRFIENTFSVREIQTSFLSAFTNTPLETMPDKELENKTIVQLAAVQNILSQGKFLFDDGIDARVRVLQGALYKVVIVPANFHDCSLISERKQEYAQSIRDLVEDYYGKIQDSLKLY